MNKIKLSPQGLVKGALANAPYITQQTQIVEQPYHPPLQ